MIGNAEVNELIHKLKRIAVALNEEKDISEDNLILTYNFLNETVDMFLLKQDSIANLIHQRTIKNKTRVLEFKIDIDTNDSSMFFSNLHQIIYLLKICYSYIINKTPIFSFYIYSEIKNMLLFYVRSSIEKKYLDSVDNWYSIKDMEYHEQNTMFKYLFSIFDKWININDFLITRYDLYVINKSNPPLYFTRDFAKLSLPFLKSRIAGERLNNYLTLLNKSALFHYIRTLRNNIEHSFTDPKKRYNIAIEIETLYILLARTAIETAKNFKPDSEIYKLFDKK